MMKHKSVFICLFIWLFLALSCGISGPGGAFLAHINKVQSILEKDSGTPETAMEKVIAYMGKNKEKIAALSATLKQLTPEETEEIYLPILNAQKALERYITTHPTEDNPFRANESFVGAILPLFQ